MWDGRGRRGCNKRPGPRDCYLDGGDMHATAGEIYRETDGLLGAYAGVNAVCCPACFAVVMPLLVGCGGSTLHH